jgi:OOP family OmpA-OmpF porin
MVAGLSGAGLVLLGFITTAGDSDYHLNATQLEAKLQGKAQTALDAAGLTWASVTMDGQRATITGTAPTSEAVTEAERIVLGAAGSGGQLWGGVIGVSSDVTEGPKLAVMSPYVWRAIKTVDDKFILVGGVPDDAVRADLKTYADGVATTVEDRTELAAGVPRGGWSDVASYGMEQLALLDSGEVRLDDTVLTLSGMSADDTKRAQATAAIADLKSPWSGVANITGPSFWMAEHSGDTLILSGNVETEADKAEISGIAAQYYSGEVRDEMTVQASTNEGWTQGVRLGLPHFSQFETGKMAFEPEGDGFTFDGEASPSTLAFLREDMVKLDGDYGFDLDVAATKMRLTELDGIDLGSDPLIACQMSFDLVMANNTVTFNTGSANISRNSGETLDKIIAVAGTCADNLSFQVGGHTDSSGDRDVNVALSKSRAQAVANYMTGAGFGRSRLRVEGFGPDRPKADNATPQGRAANRRIEFQVQEWSE